MTGEPARPAGQPGKGEQRVVPPGSPTTEEDLPGDPVCLLRRVCPACGAVANTDPPTTCPQCRSHIPAA